MNWSYDRLVHVHAGPARPGLAAWGGPERFACVERNRYLDLLRVVAISGVVYGHWLLINLTARR